jgi:hypothetical protein
MMHRYLNPCFGWLFWWSLWANPTVRREVEPEAKGEP